MKGYWDTFSVENIENTDGPSLAIFEVFVKDCHPAGRRINGDAEGIPGPSNSQFLVGILDYLSIRVPAIIFDASGRTFKPHRAVLRYYRVP